MPRNVVDELVVRLTADATRLQAELGKAETQAKTGGQRIGASFAAAFKTAAQFGAIAVTTVTAVGTALTVAANKAAAYADEIDKASLRTRLSRGSVQELRFAADQLGGTFGDVETAVNGLTLRLAGAEQGSERQTEAFRRLGVATRDAGGELRSTEDLFFETVTALQGVKNETERAVLAQEVFGRSAASLAPILAAGAGSLEDVRKQARELGIVLSDQSIGALVAYKDQLSAVQQQFGSLGRELTTQFLPVLTAGLLPAISQQVIPALRDLVERTVGVADAFDETGAPTQDFKDRIEAIAAQVGGLITNLVALGEVSVGLVQVVTAPFAALGNVLGQLSVGVPNFLDAYRRAFSGDFSGFRGRPIDTLVPDVGDILAVALEQANVGLSGIRAGAGRFGSFVPGAPGSSAFVPSTRTSGASGIGPFGSVAPAGAPAGTDTDPVAVTFGSRANFPTGLAADLALRNAPRNVVPGVFDSRVIPIPGVSSTQPTQSDIQAARAAQNELARDASLAAAGLRTFTSGLEGLRTTRLIPIPGASVDVAGARAIPLPDVTVEAQTLSQVQAFRSETNAVALEAIKAEASLRAFTASLETLRTTRAIPIPGVTAGITGTPLSVGIPLPNVKGIEDATNAQIAAVRAQAAAALQTKQAIITAGVTFASDLAGAIKSGSPSGIFGSLTGGIGSLIGIANPFAGGLFSLLGGLFAGFLPNGNEAESEAARAAGASARGAPAIELNLSVFQNLAVASLTGESRAAVDGLLNDTVTRIESVLTSFGTRLTAVEARTA